MPYWDRLPLVIPFNIYDDGFIGINLHYANGNDRKTLLNYLLRLRNKKTTKEYVKISYQILQAAAKTSILQPCIHRYLTNHIKTRLVKVSIDEWENVALLPLAQWKRGAKL